MACRLASIVLVSFLLAPIICYADGEVGQQAANGANADGKEDAQESEEYYELLKLFADTLDQVDRNYVKEISRRELLEAAIEGMFSKLDPYSSYIPPSDIERFKSGVESEFGGIGIRVSTDDGFLTVISPIVGSPAYDAGLVSGDRIVAIEGKSTKGITIDGAVKLLKGKVGTKVKVSVLHREAEKPVDLMVDRQIVRVATVLGDTRNADDSWNFFIDEENKIGYIRLTGFSRRTTSELKEAMKHLAKEELRGLIIDLRFNPGGLLSAAIEISDMFISEGRIVSTEGRSIPKRVWDAHEKGSYTGFPMAVLVNRYSASASEILSACLQDHDRAVIIGERSFGKGSVQNIINLEGGRSALKLTTAAYQRPSGKNIHRFPDAKEEDDWGVSPNEGNRIRFSDEELSGYHSFRRERDIVGRKPEEGEKFEDRQLTAALFYLKGKLSGKNETTAAADEPPQP